MLGLHQVERKMKQVLPATDDWVELEERRRTFWAAYIADKWASTANNWPMMMDEEDVCIYWVREVNSNND